MVLGVQAGEARGCYVAPGSESVMSRVMSGDTSVFGQREECLGIEFPLFLPCLRRLPKASGYSQERAYVIEVPCICDCGCAAQTLR